MTTEASLEALQEKCSYTFPASFGFEIQFLGFNILSVFLFLFDVIKTVLGFYLNKNKQNLLKTSTTLEN